MLSRRSFLKHSGMITLSSFVSGKVGAGTLECLRPASVKVFVAETGMAAEAFSKALPFLACSRTDIALDLNFHDATVCVREHEVDLLVGLTRDSEFVLMSQIAEENGYLLIYQGHHHVQEQGVRHSLSGSPTVVDSLGRKLSEEGGPWPARVAGSLPDICNSTGLTRQEAVFCRHSSPEEVPAFLVSWVFRNPASQ